MGSDQRNIPSKPRYDITMSRRTRKPLMNLKEASQNPTTGSPEEEGDAEDVLVDHDQGAESFPKKADYEKDRKRSLKQLIIKNAGKEKSEVTKLVEEETRGGGDDENMESKLLFGSRNSLGQHFKGEEKQQLQVVTRKQSNNGMEGMKLKGMVGRYVKVLSHLIRVKRDTHINNGSRKKSVLRLPK
ncbi:unnamed protein product [Dovyalis caffra]|uniref:Uncharacterized protein n=1 Tax=Dovyalis caffra TaxID=77055 RepID=A0AAV1RBQ9_9ROSI|nr:unnamed protein product [Dovyalis caffra]